MLLLRFAGVWVTAPDLSDINAWSPAIAVVPPALDQIVQHTPGLRAPFQMTVARFNQTNTRKLKVARRFESYWSAEQFAQLHAGTMPTDGLAEWFLVNFSGTVLAAWTQANAALQIGEPQHDGGVQVVTEYIVNGESDTILSEPFPELLGLRNIMEITRIWPAPLEANAVFGHHVSRVAERVYDLTLELGIAADADVTVILVDGDGMAVEGASATIPAGDLRIRSEFESGIALVAAAITRFKVTAVGSNAAPGQYLTATATTVLSQ